MGRIIPFVLILLIAVAVGCAAQMTTLHFDSLGCSIGLPDAWRRNTAREGPVGKGEVTILLSAVKVIGADSVDVMLTGAMTQFSEQVDVADLAEGKAQAFGEGVALDTRRRWTLAGADAVCFSGTLRNGKRIRSLMVITKNRLYSLICGSNRRELLDDADVEAIRASFSFIGEQKFPVLDFARVVPTRFTFAQEGIDVTIPASWARNTRAENPPDGMILVADDVAGPDSTMLMVHTMGVFSMPSIRIPEFKEAILADLRTGSEIESTGYVTLGGIEALEVTGYMPQEKRHYRSLFAVANHRVYLVMINSLRKEATSEAETRPILAGFSFIGTPELPSASGGGR